jgi:hypothetical protein
MVVFAIIAAAAVAAVAVVSVHFTELISRSKYLPPE